MRSDNDAYNTDIVNELANNVAIILREGKVKSGKVQYIGRVMLNKIVIMRWDFSDKLGTWTSKPMDWLALDSKEIKKLQQLFSQIN